MMTDEQIDALWLYRKNLHDGQEAVALLGRAIERMDRARNILTDGKPRPDCNWGMLDTSDLKSAPLDTGASGGGVASELHEAAREFHNLTQGDPYVVISPPTFAKRDAIIEAGDRLRKALAASPALLQDCSANPADCPNNEGYGCECTAASAGDLEVGS